MKPIVHKDLIKRIKCASENGSKVATAILGELQKCGDNDISTIISRKANYFESKRMVSHGYESDYGFTVINIVITCCTKDIENENFPDRDNPSAPYLSENRTSISPVKFAKLFDDVCCDESITDEDYDFFDNVIRINSKVQISMSDSIDDIRNAYDGANYYQYADNSSSPLHHSCMRHDSRNLPSRVADFYANFAGASILTAKDDDGNILGRAMVWKNVFFESLHGNASLIERVYFCFESVRKMMQQYAKNIGINCRKTYNTYDSQTEFTFVNDFENDDVSYKKGEDFCSVAYVVVPANKWHKSGSPYLDTFSYLLKSNNSNELVLGNSCINDYFAIAILRNTNGTASFHRGVCPVCGCESDSPYTQLDSICDGCQCDLYVDSDYGTQFVKGMRKYNDRYYPSVFFDDNGEPKDSFLIHLRLQRLM